MKNFSRFFPLVLFLVLTFIFFYPFFLQGKLPIPSDTIIGLYHPFRDLYSEKYPNGITYKNALITDPVRQQYPWKEYAITSLKKGVLPVWNPYEMAGKPQIANFQTGVFYPLNLLLFVSPFYFSWSFFIILQPLLASIFMYLFLRNLKIAKAPAVFGSISFSFSGFMISWMEWGVVGHTYIWMPLLLLAVDKGFLAQNIKWKAIFILALISSFFAGHLQTFFYSFFVVVIYFSLKVSLIKKRLKIVGSFIFDLLIFIAISSFQWYPTLHYILLSNRANDQSYSQPGWFIPYQNLIQLFAPDFFGNPATLNYYGVWNYGEFIGYIGILGLLFACYSILFRRDKKTFFFVLLLFGSILFATENFISKISYEIQIPFFSSAQPTRLIGIVAFSISILAALGFDYFIKTRKNIIIPIFFVLTVLASATILTRFPNFFPSVNDATVAFNNLKLPIVVFVLSSFFLLILSWRNEKNIKQLITILILFLSVFDLFRFGWKFTPFTPKEYLFPNTEIISFLEKNIGNGRIAVLDDRILPPNFQTAYKIPAITGYDPLYLTNYAELIASNERSDHSINPPFGYNRIITPRNYSSQIFDLLSVKYLLSFDYIEDSKLQLVLEEGTTKLYQNKSVFPAAFFVSQVMYEQEKESLAKKMYSNDLVESAFSTDLEIEGAYSIGSINRIYNSESTIVINTQNQSDGFLVLSQIYYPNSIVTIDGERVMSYEVNMALTGIKVPSGSHIIEHKRSLF